MIMQNNQTLSSIVQAQLVNNQPVKIISTHNTGVIVDGTLGTIAIAANYATKGVK